MSESGARSRPSARRVILLLLSGIAAGALLFTVAFVVWASTPYRADDTALAAIESDDLVEVVEGRDRITFVPQVEPSGAGLVLYPGGRVDHAAYAPFARRLAEEGHLVVIVRMPLNLAVFGIDRAEDVLAEHSDVRSWVVGGHSLGGAMAAEFVARRPGAAEGLLMLAAYPGASTDLSTEETEVLTIVATQDGLIDSAEIEAGRLRLPRSARVLSVPGGNHAGFGSYGTQRGDGESELPEGVQLEFVARSVDRMLDGLSAAGESGD